MGYNDLLISKGFSLNSYPEGEYWEFVITDDEELKYHVCEIFQADIDMFDSGIADIDTLILQCAKDFSQCLFYYDCNPFDMSTEEFMKCVERI